MKELEKVLEKYFLTKAPKLPADIQKLIVQYGPYVLAVLLVLSIMSLLSMFGFNAMVYNPLRMLAGPTLGMWYQVYLVFTVIVVVLQALALPGLFKRSMTGWRYMFYAALVSLVQNIITMNIAGLIVGSGLTFYLMYQIRHHYK
jgi:hypothetical protein